MCGISIAMRVRRFLKRSGPLSVVPETFNLLARESTTRVVQDFLAGPGTGGSGGRAVTWCRTLEADRSRYHGGYTALICAKGKCRTPYVVESILNPPSREAAASAETGEEPDLVSR